MDKDYQKNSIWHSLKGEYHLADGEQVVIAFAEGFQIVRYNKKKDVWYDENGKEYIGGMAMLPLPTPQEALAQARELIKDELYANL